jgi:hypothetical protein
MVKILKSSISFLQKSIAELGPIGNDLRNQLNLPGILNLRLAVDFLADFLAEVGCFSTGLAA